MATAAPDDGDHVTEKQNDPVSDSDDAASAAAADAVPVTQTLARLDIAQLLGDQLGAPPPASPRSFQGIAWPLLALLLVLALSGQYLYFARTELVRYESLRPWLERACGRLGCELPLRHAPDQIELLSRDVISHPRIRNALLINATFVNRAKFVQVYPVLQISLSDESGAVVAMRRFQPEEYLAQGLRVAAGMEPGAPVRVVLEVTEPKRSATSFQFEFL